MGAERPRDKVPIPGTDGWLRVTTTHGNVFYAQKKTKRSEWTIPHEIRDQVLALERSMGLDSVVDDAPAQKRARLDEDECARDQDQASEPHDVNAHGDESGPSLRGQHDDDAPPAEAQPASEPPTHAEGSTTGLTGTSQEPEILFEEGREKYMAMLTSLNGTPKEVNPMAPWDRELPKFVHEPDYRALPTLQDREDVFNEWCKLRVREKRALAQSRSSEDKFVALLHKQVASTRTTFAAFKQAFQKDPVYRALVTDKSEARAEQLFRTWLVELGEIKLKKAAEAEGGFRALLSDKLSADEVLRDARLTRPVPKDDALRAWSTAKKTPGLAEDPRYDAVGSATRRAELFCAWLAQPAAPTAAPMTRAERQARALDQRVAQVHRERERHQRQAEHAMHDALEEQRVSDWQQMLIDAVRDPWLTWDEAQYLLARDARFAPAQGVQDTLSIGAKRELFEQHLQRLRAKRREQLGKLFDKHAQNERGVPQLYLGADVVLPLVRADEAYLQSALPHFVGESASVTRAAGHTSLEAEFQAWDAWRQQQAREDFMAMLRENAFLDFWGRLRKERADPDADKQPAQEDEDEDDMTVPLLTMATQLDLDAMESVLKVRAIY